MLNNKKHWWICRAIYCATPIIVALTTVLHAMPPHPSLTDESSATNGSAAPSIPSNREWHARGICTPDDFGLKIRTKISGTNGTTALTPAATSFRILALLVEFSDNPASVSPPFFDSLVFGTTGNTVKDYFSEISSAQIDIVTVNLPSSVGWSIAPNSYAYYVDGQNGTGAYPNNSQKLVEDLVDMVDPVLNFSNYDNDLDGDVDVLLVIHSGSGAEFSGDSNDIWSHKWSISPRTKDGVIVSSYTVQPEYWTSPGDMTIGVYSHELCHGFGLPDLYDIDGSSHGIGRWGIMSTGSWNGPSGLGESPSYPSAWSRIQMGVASATNVTNNLVAEPLNAIESGGSIYRLWSSGTIGSEYFLVENRQQSGYDTHLRGNGLLIWHIDEAMSGNNSEWYPGIVSNLHYLVSLEQADGNFELEHNIDLGDNGDPFPGSTNRQSFFAASAPSSDKYSGGTSFVEVLNISSSSASMTADLMVGVAVGLGDQLTNSLPTTHELRQNYPNPFNPLTVIGMTLNINTDVRLDIYNILGQTVTTLLNGNAGPGAFEINWDGTDQSGSSVASGVYFYKLITDDFEQTRKMVLLR